MKKVLIAGCVAAVCSTGVAMAQPQSVNRSANESTPAVLNYQPALRSLQDARKTLAALNEESMSREARQSLEKVSTDFREMYKAFTGEEPNDEKSTATAKSTHTPDPAWSSGYQRLTSDLRAMLGPDAASNAASIAAHSSTATQTAGTTGTSTVGTTGVSGSAPQLSKQVHDDLTKLRQELDNFNKAAGQTTRPSKAK